MHRHLLDKRRRSPFAGLLSRGRWQQGYHDRRRSWLLPSLPQPQPPPPSPLLPWLLLLLLLLILVDYNKSTNDTCSLSRCIRTTRIRRSRQTYRRVWDICSILSDSTLIPSPLENRRPPVSKGRSTSETFLHTSHKHTTKIFPTLSVQT